MYMDKRFESDEYARIEVKVDLRDPANLRAIVRRTIWRIGGFGGVLGGMSDKLLRKEGLTKDGDWVVVGDGKEYPENTFLPVYNVSRLIGGASVGKDDSKNYCSFGKRMHIVGECRDCKHFIPSQPIAPLTWDGKLETNSMCARTLTLSGERAAVFEDFGCVHWEPGKQFLED
jgi:hypothetical protein